MSGAVPERVRHALDALSVEPEESLLELGCGGGVAVALVCERLRGGTITAIDRSPIQIARAERRNAEHIAAGRARFATPALEELDFPGALVRPGLHDQRQPLLGRGASPELAVLARLLKPGGAFWLFYDPPSPARTASVTTALLESLAEGGFASIETSSSPLLRVVARPHPADELQAASLPG